MQRGLFLLLGVALGAAVVLTTLHLASVPAEKSASGTTPKVASLASGTAPVGVQTPPETAPSGPATGSKRPDSQTSPPSPAPADSPPFNPLVGSIASTPPKEITGSINPGPTVPLPNPSDTHVTPIDDPNPPKGALINLRLDVPDPAAAIKALQALAAKEGGSAIQFDEAAMRSDPEGAILFVPTSKSEDAQRQIGAIGKVVISDTWTGSPPDRLDRVEQVAQNRLGDLHIQRQELLVKFFEDAPQVRHVDEDSDRISKCIASLRAHKPGSNLVVIKIRFVG